MEYISYQTLIKIDFRQALHFMCLKSNFSANISLYPEHNFPFIMKESFLLPTTGLSAIL